MINNVLNFYNRASTILTFFIVEKIVNYIVNLTKIYYCYNDCYSYYCNYCYRNWQNYKSIIYCQIKYAVNKNIGYKYLIDLIWLSFPGIHCLTTLFG